MGIVLASVGTWQPSQIKAPSVSGDQIVIAHASSSLPGQYNKSPAAIDSRLAGHTFAP
jgi:hypothetical protein